MYPLSDGLFAAKNQWYIAAWDDEISRTPMERWILDEPVAFYRTEDGTAVALEGRCPHRSFPLGKSRVVGNDLQCGYHGISFRPDGSCAAIPSQMTVPSVCKVRSYPLVKQFDWFWIWMGDPALADESLIPSDSDLGLADGHHLFAGGGYNLVPGRYMLLHDNLFDLTHLGYLHQNSFGGGGGAQDTVPKITTGERWIATHYTQKNVENPAFFAKMLDFHGQVDRFQGLKLFLPCLHVGGTQIHLPSESETRGQELGSVCNFHAVTPATRHTAHYFYAVGQSWSTDIAVSRRLFDYVFNNVIPEDISGTAYIEDMITRMGERPTEILIRSDNACVTGRRMFEKMIRAELDSGDPGGRAGSDQIATSYGLEFGSASPDSRIAS